MQRWQRRLLGVLALGGSFTGLVLVLTLLVGSGSIASKAFPLPFLALYVWGMICGLRLLEGDDKAAHQNFLFWLVQLPYLQSPLAGYIFSSGASLYFTFQPSIEKWGFSAHLGSNFVYSLLQTEMPLVLGINIFALVVSGYLFLLVRRAPPNNSFKPNPLRGSA